MDELVESVGRLHDAEMGTLIMRLELGNLKAELNFIDIPGLRVALTEAQEAYENELDALASILQLFTPARLRRGLTDVDRRVGRQLQDVMYARQEKEGAHKRWWRGTRRAQNVRNMIRLAEEELASLIAVE